MGLRPGYKQTAVGVIPDEWACTKVRGIASTARNAIVGGPFGSDLVSADYVEHGVPVIRGTNMNGQWVSGTFVFVTPSKAKSLEANLARPGDIVFTQRGTLGQVSLVPDKPFESYLVSQSQMKLSVKREAAEPLFYYYVFTSDDQQDLIREGTIQTGVPHINLGILRDIPVQLPPLPEQRAIAEALSDVDALLGALDRLIAKKRDLKQAAMQQLLTGQTRLPGFHGEWEVKRFGEVASPRRDRVDPRTVGVQDFCVELEHIGSASGELLGSTSTGEQSSLKSVFRSGDVLFGKLRAYLRKYWLATRSGVCSTEVWVLAPKDRLVATAFLFQLIKTDEFIEAASNSYGTHMPRSDWNIVKNYEFKVPPIVEQTAIAAVLGDMDAELAALTQRRTKTHALKQAMMQELLTGKTRLV